MAQDIKTRETKTQNAEKTARAFLEKEYSFRPELNIQEHLIRNRKGGWDSLSAPLRRYTDEYQPYHDDNNFDRSKKKKRKSKRRPIESLWERR